MWDEESGQQGAFFVSIAAKEGYGWVIMPWKTSSIGPWGRI